MKLQTLLKDSSEIDEKLEFMKEWEELTYRLDSQVLGDCYLFVLEIPDEDFDKSLDIFASREEAMGAFLSVATESGWELVPETYTIYHAQFEDGKLIAGLKTEEGIQRYEQTTLENMISNMAKFPRIVVFSYDVITYIKDIYPDVDYKVYVLSRELSRVGKPIPSIEGMSIEEVIELIEKLLKDESLPPISKPVMEC